MSVAVHTVLNHIHRLAGAVGRKGRTDRELLEEFTHLREESAFSHLVRRHGPMVFGVCRRVLGHQQDAEDVFQATFLVLARKAGSVRWEDSVANWLYGVAYRLAQKSRTGNARRRKHQVQSEVEPAVVGPQPGQWQELRAILDEELQRLPEKYRAPLVLCYLEGKTRDEAAQQLGWTLPVVKGRLERGRNLLRERLTRRGLALSAALLPLALVEGGSHALGTPLVSQTVTAAAKIATGQALAGSLSPQVLALAQGALQTMFLNKIKLAAFTVLSVALLGGSLGLLGQHVLPQLAAANGPETGPSLQPILFNAADGEKEGREKEKTLKGLLKSIDAKTGVIVVTTQKDGEGKVDHKLSLAGKNIKVTSSLERAIKLDELMAGDRVTVSLSEADDVTGIRVEGPNPSKGGGEGGKKRPGFVQGVLKKVDPAKNTITLSQKKEGGGESEKIFELSKETRVAIAGKEGAGLADLKTGEPVTVALGENQIVIGIKSGLVGDGEGRPKEGDGKQLVGELVSVDKAKQTITVTQRGEGGAKEKTLSLDQDVKIFLGRDKNGTLDELKPGSKLTLLLKNDKVSGIRPFQAGGKEKPGIPVFLKEVNSKESTIIATVKGDGGVEKERTFTVSKEVKVIVPGKENASLQDLKGGVRVFLQLGGDRQTVVGIRVAGEEPGRKKEQE